MPNAVAEKEPGLFDSLDANCDIRNATHESAELFSAFCQIALCCKAAEVWVGSKGIFELIRSVAKLSDEKLALRVFRIVAAFKLTLRKEQIVTKSGRRLKFSLNNSLTSQYARRFDERFPEHEGYFEERLTSKDIYGG